MKSNDKKKKGGKGKSWTARNRRLVLLRKSDPGKWSFRELGKKFGIGATTAEDIFKRDIAKFA